MCTSLNNIQRFKRFKQSFYLEVNFSHYWLRVQLSTTCLKIWGRNSEESFEIKFICFINCTLILILPKWFSINFAKTDFLYNLWRNDLDLSYSTTSLIGTIYFRKYRNYFFYWWVRFSLLYIGTQNVKLHRFSSSFY